MKKNNFSIFIALGLGGIFLLGNYFFSMKNFQQATETPGIFIEQNTQENIFLGHAYYAEKKYKKAQEIYEKNSQEKNISYYLGNTFTQLFFETGDISFLQEAKKNYEYSIQKNNLSESIHNLTIIQNFFLSENIESFEKQTPSQETQKPEKKSPLRDSQTNPQTLERNRFSTEDFFLHWETTPDEEKNW